MNAVTQLELKVLPRLRDFATHLRSLFPNLKAQVYSLPEGRLAEWQGYDVCMDCPLAGVPDDQPGNFALSVCVFHLTTSPMLSADVAWGHPSGCIVDEFSEQPVPFSEEAISQLELVLPRLAQSLKTAIRVGPPP